MLKFIQQDPMYHSYRVAFDGQNTSILAIRMNTDHVGILDVIKGEEYKILGYFKNNLLGKVIVLESKNDCFEESSFFSESYVDNISVCKKIDETDKQDCCGVLDKNIEKSAEQIIAFAKNEISSHIPSIRIISDTSMKRRFWNFIKNPFTYIFKGTIEW